jgi:DNA-binding CsgD family transcriptional regulator/tetratricopeptide (TPR) repeat protein
VELVEREPYLDQLEACLEQARAGSGRLVFLGGEAGAGKTSLARRFVEGRSDRVRVLWGACDPLSTPGALAPFYDMPPVAPLLEARLGRYELLTALLHELRLYTVMVAEDVHWADEATLDALRFVGRRITGARSVVVATYRDDELGAGHPLRAVLGDLATAAGCERVHVPPLSPEGVRALAAGSAVDPDRLHRATGGNPFYVSEVLAAPGFTVPASVADAVLARASRLSDAARVLVDVVSLSPGGLETEIAELLAGASPEALDEAVERGVLVASGPRLSFRHELARLAIEAAVPSGRRRRLQLELLQALEDRGADLARLAHHADAAGAGERVLRYATEAAREASARGAHREAARQYERAVSYADRLPASDLADLLFAWAEERVGIDEPADRTELIERIVALRRESGDVRGLGLALALLGRTLWSMGRVREAFDRVAEAVEVLEPLPPSPELARAYAAYSLQTMLSHRGDETLRWGTRAIELAERVDAPVALRVALNSVGTVQLACFENPEGIELLERAIRLAAADGDDWEVGRALSNLGAALTELRRYEEAAGYLEQAVSFGEEHDLDGVTGQAKAELAKIRFEQGRWDEADGLAAEALRYRDVGLGIPITALCARGRAGVRRGDSEAASILEEAWALAGHTGDLQWTWPLAAGRAEAAWLAGRAADIRALVEPLYEQALELDLRWAIGELGSWLVRAQALDRLPAELDVPYALPWREAAEAWRRIGCPYEQAEALADGDEPALRESLAILVRLGAEPAADRVRAAMRRAGLKGVPPRPRASTLAAPAQLTRRQLEVLALLENGLSNAEIASRLFISEKTAGHHVSAILQKLGATSRGEAAAAARKLGIAAAQR